MTISRRRLISAIVLTAALTLLSVQFTAAEEKKAEINTFLGIRQTLSSMVGQRVLLKTQAGDVEGTVVSVGDLIVHVSRLTGKDFYDAVVVIDKINSVVFRARNQ